ncbi:SRPBCC domain-containing protein [Deinococcus sp. KSM4-11]|uniref:SRPBCC family protein n=1 Tax=Deinococcus sp. KSM4-11 TaxID=2568654 RepID=UPI0010A40696|nr:SRPBCC domain-containing protein [Deinococcus sp. KSM4-11]THF85206.1 SRPBCC domain-containing protein [Deinococcus sp. KSM4-11]
MTSRESVHRTVILRATPARVWTALIQPEQMARWMADFPLSIAVTWEVGAALHMTGDLHGLPFENRGTVLEVVPLRRLRFTYWSTLTGRPYTEADIPVVQFTLSPEGGGTRLELTHGHVPAGPEHQHLPFYWNAALLKLGDLLAAPAG